MYTDVNKNTSLFSKQWYKSLVSHIQLISYYLGLTRLEKSLYSFTDDVIQVQRTHDLNLNLLEVCVVDVLQTMFKILIQTFVLASNHLI